MTAMEKTRSHIPASARSISVQVGADDMQDTAINKPTTPAGHRAQVAASSTFGENESHCAIGQYFSNSV